MLKRKGNTLDVWFDEPELEVLCEETREEIILKKDKSGRVIGFEKLNFLAFAEPKCTPARMPAELIVE